ncbi:MAG: hypothetical protein Q8S21_06410 [Candidatus Paracaedibacteraceae bacterium]|nr:hypothetical protein [Candidatus Paracaedibacteraceae bacterium]
MKNTILILALLCIQSICPVIATSVDEEGSCGNVKTIVVEHRTGDIVTRIPEVPYSDLAKRHAIEEFRKELTREKTLIVRLRNHEKHQSLTEIYGINSFEEKLSEFVPLANMPKVVYLNTVPEEIALKNTYYVDAVDGKNNPFDRCGGLGKFRLSLKSEKKFRYFVAYGIQDCLFLTVFNIATKASFNTHTNYSLFADFYARDFAAFQSTLKRSLEEVKGKGSDNNSLQITLISSYLSTGMKSLYDMIDEMGYMKGSRVFIDFNTASTKGYVPKNFIIRTVAAPSQDHLQKDSFTLDWTRPICVYINPLVKLNAPIKNIVFDAVTGEHFQI